MPAKTILPVYLSPGYVSIYGAGLVSIYGMTGPANIRFGRVYQAYANPIQEIVGMAVMYKEEDCIQINNTGTVLNLLPADKIILIEKEL